MGCGCSGGVKHPQNKEKIIPLMVLSESTVKTRAAICDGCSYRKDQFCNKLDTLLTPLVMRNPNFKCEYWPDSQGIVKKWGMKWYGLPYPLRMKIAFGAAFASFNKRLKSEFFGDCGCNKGLKDLWIKIKSCLGR